MPISQRLVPFLAMMLLAWALTGATPETSGQSGGTVALKSAEASLELTREERRRVQMGLAAEGSP